MLDTPPTQPTLRTAAEVAVVLRCSEWWVKEQARRRRIPFCWIGGSYRFTDEHVTAIVRLFEVSPEAAPTATTPVRQLAVAGSESVGRLRPRAPRRMRGDSSTVTAA
jgi:hypothetical protein